MKVAIGIFALWLVDLCERWFYSHDVDIPEGGLFPDRWIAWGTIRHVTPAYDHRYFVLTIPFVWQWREAWHINDDRIRLGWHHPCLFRRGHFPLAAAPRAQWRFFWREVMQ